MNHPWIKYTDVSTKDSIAAGIWRGEGLYKKLGYDEGDQGRDPIDHLRHMAPIGG